MIHKNDDKKTPGTGKEPAEQSQPKDEAGKDPTHLRPQRAPDPDKGDQPAAESKDATREGVGDFSTPAPGYVPAADRGPGDRSGKVQTGEPALPRVIKPGDRAPKGLTRYKIRATDSSETQPTLYILAKDEDSACKCYLESTGQLKKLERARKHDKDAPEPELSVTELPD